LVSLDSAGDRGRFDAASRRRPRRGPLFHVKRRAETDVRLGALVERYHLGPGAVGALKTLMVLLTDDAAPTTVHDPLRIVDVHIADSLSGLEVPALQAATCVADLGSGAGLPAVVLALAKPAARVFAVESVGRKAAFITGVAEAMGLRNLEVVPRRAEEWTAPSGGCDAVCARALAGLPVLVEYAAPLLRHGGVLVAWKATVSEEERRDGEIAASKVGMRLQQVRPVHPFADAASRALYVYEKAAETPPGYPRRAGMAAKRPLRAT